MDALYANGLRCGEDFFLAFSPEREDPGNGFYSTHSIPKVVGADDDKSRALAMAVDGHWDPLFFDHGGRPTTPLASAASFL